MEDEGFNEPNPPSADKVARRAIVLAVVACRGIVEADRANAQGASDLAKRSYDWLRAIGLEDELSVWECRVLEATVGQLSDRDRINASWLSEAVVVLAWSLGKMELPDLPINVTHPVLQTAWVFCSRPRRLCSISRSFVRAKISTNTMNSSTTSIGGFGIFL